MIKISLLTITALLLLACTGTTAAFSDDCERYSTDWSEKWTASSMTTASVVQYPTDYSTSHSIYLKKTTSTQSSWQYGTYTTNNFIFNDYVSFVIRKHQVTSGYFSTSGRHSRGYVKLLNDDDVEVASYELWDYSSQTSLNYLDDTPKFFELVRSGHDVYIYQDGVLLGDIGDVDSGSYRLQFKIGGLTYYSAYPVTSQLWIDDISTGSIVGMDPEWTEMDDEIEVSHTIQSYYSYPDSQFSLDITCLSGTETGLINSTTISGATGFTSYDRATVFGDNYGLYMMELLRGSEIMADTYFTYSQLADPIQYPDVLFLAGADVDADIRDDDNNGGTISGGEEIYLYPTPADSGNYNISFDIEELPYSFEAQIKKVYATALNDTTIQFSGLAGQNYLIEIDGESISGTKATGTLAISGNVSDGETVTIGSDVYEFDNDDATTGDNIPVEIGSNLTLTAGNLVTEINNNGTAAVSANATVNDLEIPEGFTYIAECVTINLIATDYGTSGNSITTIETLTNGSFAAATLTGGTAGSQTEGADEWEYTLTDWTNYSEHEFSFSPDMTLPGVWGYVKDSSTQDGLASATITIQNGSSTSYLYTDSNGMYYKTTGMVIGTYNVSAAKSGYSDSIPMDVTTIAGATTRQDFYLDASDGAGVYYAPHYTSFMILQGAAAQNGITLKIYEPNETTALYSDTTGIDGIAAFELDKNTRYKLEFYDTENILITSFYLFPSSEMYVFDPWALAGESESGTAFSSLINYGITGAPLNLTAGYINTTVTSQDTDANNTITITLIITNSTDTIILQTSGTINTSSPTWTYNQTVALNDTYSVNLTINHPNYDQKRILKTFDMFSGVDPKWQIHGWDQQWYYYVIGTLGVLMIAFLFSYINASWGAVAVPLIGLFLAGKGYLPSNAYTTVIMLTAILYFGIAAAKRGGAGA